MSHHTFHIKYPCHAISDLRHQHFMKRIPLSQLQQRLRFYKKPKYEGVWRVNLKVHRPSHPFTCSSDSYLAKENGRKDRRKPLMFYGVHGPLGRMQIAFIRSVGYASDEASGAREKGVLKAKEKATTWCLEFNGGARSKRLDFSERFITWKKKLFKTNSSLKINFVSL